MAQAVQHQTFTLQDFKTEAGIAKLNLWVQQVSAQVQMMQGTLGNIKPDADIDLQGKWKVINAKT